MKNKLSTKMWDKFGFMVIFSLILMLSLSISSSNNSKGTTFGKSQRDDFHKRFGTAKAKGRYFVFGPTTFKPDPKSALKISETFNVTNPKEAYSLKVWKVKITKKSYPIDLKITLNGKEIISGKEVFGKDNFMQVAVDLNQFNTIELAGKPSSNITVAILTIDKTAPSIRAIITPAPNKHGWNNTDVKIRFVGKDNESGISSCTKQITMTEETKGKKIIGTAVDRAGNKSTASVLIRIDKSPPIIDLTWPPDPEFVTNFSKVKIEGTLTDSLSGLHSIPHFADLFKDKKPVKSKNISLFKPLDTAIQKGAISADNSIELVVTDYAGNQSIKSINVRYTNGNAMNPTNLNKVEKYKGITASFNRAMLKFKKEVTAKDIFEFATNNEGNIAGFLPKSKTAVVEFRSRYVRDLNRILQNVKQKYDVIISACPVVIWEPQQFDNELLQPGERRAYDSVNLTQAQNSCLNQCNQCHSSRKVGVAIIDSGLDTSFGQNNEFANINFYDMTTLEGQNGIQTTPIDNTGHGTKITGVIAGANNGSGNNGIISGVTHHSAFDINVFRTHNSTTISSFDGSLIFAALDLITEEVVPNIDVANLGYGLGATTPEAAEWLMFSHWNYFNSAKGRHILWVAPAGNNNQQVSCNDFILYPAGMACKFWNVVSVGGFNPNGFERAEDSNYGNPVTVYAPGESVYTAVGPNNYGFAGGTSISTAFVTGAVAFYKAFNNFHPPSLMRPLLKNASPLRSDGTVTMRTLDINNLMSSQRLRATLEDKIFNGTSGGGSKTVQVSGNVTRPGLAGFFFDFEDDDHEIDTIKTGFFLASPNVVLNSSTFLDYSDGNNDDDYSWKVYVQELPYGTRFFEKQATNLSEGVSILLQDRCVGVPVLLGFDLMSRDGEQEIEEIEVRLFEMFGALYLQTKFENDNTTSFKYNYVVTYALVPPDRVKKIGTTSGGVDDETGKAIKVIHARQPVLQGFKFLFHNGAHHLNKIGVRLYTNRIKTWYCDKNKDDPYLWVVNWVDLL